VVWLLVRRITQLDTDIRYVLVSSTSARICPEECDIKLGRGVDLGVMDGGVEIADADAAEIKGWSHTMDSFT
jgi:hypothetical protein